MKSNLTAEKNRYRLYGEKPYSVAVLHGGPGTPGSMGYLAKTLSDQFGVVEPFQTARSIAGQIEELHSVIQSVSAAAAVKLVGHSWGAWLAFIFTAQYPSLVAKLILIGAGSFDEEHNSDVRRIRLDRLDREERAEMLRLGSALNDTTPDDSTRAVFRSFGELMSKADSYDCLEVDDAPIDFQPGVYRSVWPEAERLRHNGSLLDLASSIACPVVAIHGDYDPHPAAGVRDPLAQKLRDFRFVLLDKCGHYPWKEKHARDDFFRIIRKELSERGA